MDDKKRMPLWEEHISNFRKREELSKHFGFRNIEKALQDLRATDAILHRIEKLISSELISIGDDEKLEEEILADLDGLVHYENIEELTRTVIQEKRKQASLISIFREIHNVLKTELHLLRRIRNKIKEKDLSKLKELLLELWKLINQNEFRLYKVFQEEFFLEESKPARPEIARLAKAILLQEKLEEEMETAEERFAREIVKKMSPDESKRTYVRLGEEIFGALAERAGPPISDDVVETVEKMNRFVGDEAVLQKIIRRLRPKYDEVMVKAVALAFRKAYDMGHFEHLGPDLFKL